MKASGLQPIVVCQKGHPRAPGSTSVRRSSGFNVEVSRAEDDLDKQVRDAVRFLKRHATGLHRLRRCTAFGGMTLDFGNWYRATPESPWSSYRFPAVLIELAGKHGIGIELSLYSDEPNGPRQEQ